MAKQQTEDELNIRRKARRRLVGAVALALAVVVVLPMVLENEPKPTGQDIELRIPAADKVGEFVPSAVPEIGPLAESAVVVASDVVSAVAVSGKITLAEEKLPADKPADAVQVKQAEIRPADKPADKKPADVKKPEAKQTEAKPVAAKPLEAKPEPKSADKSVTTYIVQAGAFSNPATAAQEAEKLKGWGFKAYTEDINGTTRVRVGPYTDRSKADEVRQLLEKHGQHPVVTAVK